MRCRGGEQGSGRGILRNALSRSHAYQGILVQNARIYGTRDAQKSGEGIPSCLYSNILLELLAKAVHVSVDLKGVGSAASIVVADYKQVDAQ